MDTMRASSNAFRFMTDSMLQHPESVLIATYAYVWDTRINQWVYVPSLAMVIGEYPTPCHTTADVEYVTYTGNTWGGDRSLVDVGGQQASNPTTPPPPDLSELAADITKAISLGLQKAETSWSQFAQAFQAGINTQASTADQAPANDSPAPPPTAPTNTAAKSPPPPAPSKAPYLIAAALIAGSAALIFALTLTDPRKHETYSDQ